MKTVLLAFLLVGCSVEAPVDDPSVLKPSVEPSNESKPEVSASKPEVSPVVTDPEGSGDVAIADEDQAGAVEEVSCRNPSRNMLYIDLECLQAGVWEPIRTYLYDITTRGIWVMADSGRFGEVANPYNDEPVDVNNGLAFKTMKQGVGLVWGISDLLFGSDITDLNTLDASVYQLTFADYAMEYISQFKMKITSGTSIIIIKGIEGNVGGKAYYNGGENGDFMTATLVVKRSGYEFEDIIEVNTGKLHTIQVEVADGVIVASSHKVLDLSTSEETVLGLTITDNVIDFAQLNGLPHEITVGGDAQTKVGIEWLNELSKLNL